MVAPILIPVLADLAKNGLDLISSAILSKGKDVVEKTLGVSLDEKLATPEGVMELQRLQMEKEEQLLKYALESDKLDQEYFNQETADSANARAREISLIEHGEQAGWLNLNLVPILALTVLWGGGTLLYMTNETDLRIAVVGMMTMVLGYYFGKSSSEWRKDRELNKLVAGKKGN